MNSTSHFSDKRKQEIIKSISTDATGFNSPNSEIENKSPFTKKSKISQRILFEKNKSFTQGEKLSNSIYSSNLNNNNYNNNYIKEDEYEVNFNNFHIKNFDHLINTNNINNGIKQLCGDSNDNKNINNNVTDNIQEENNAFISKITNESNIGNHRNNNYINNRVDMIRSNLNTNNTNIFKFNYYNKNININKDKDNSNNKHKYSPHFSSNSISEEEEDFNLKIIDYRRNKLDNLNKRNKYFATTNFNDYPIQQNNMNTGCSSSDEEAEMQDNSHIHHDVNNNNNMYQDNDCKIFANYDNSLEYLVDKKLLSNCLCNIKVYYMIPEKLHYQYQQRTFSNNETNTHKEQLNNSNINNIENGNLTASFVIRNNQVIKSINIKCNKSSKISELVPIAISEINKKLNKESYLLRLKKDMNECTVRFNKRSGYPDFDLPSKLMIII